MTLTRKKKLHAYFRDCSEDLEVGEKIVLKWFLNQQHGRVLSRLKWPRITKSFSSLVNAAMDICVIPNAENVH